MRPTRRRLATVAIASALLGAGAASAQGAQRIEAERMHVASATGHVVRDASASGRRALLLVGSGSARLRVRVRAPSRLTVVARGRACAGAPRLVLAVDGAPVLSRAVTARRWTILSATATVTAATHGLAVRLSNPHRSRGCRRELRVDRLLLTTAVPTGGRWVPGPGTTAWRETCW